MTTANKLTLLRMALIPVFLGLLYTGHGYWALGVFIAASLTDTLDGYIARHYDQITDFGKFMDPLADKVLVMAAMCWFVEIGRMPGWALAVVLLREFAVSGMRLVAVEQGRVIAAGWSGKVKTAATMVCLCAMLALPAPRPWDSAPDFVARIGTIVIVVTTLYSGVEYFIRNRDVFQAAK
ncbi:MAG: CDP-diacylglycerol--glycerol-3-phosphate 3-phosphatidyltransferase [Oscillospiraceae bacterium]|nr:CDP-diacylglycerol--glycerol-3-phosphate 3-phosphatidyltransferase [Oscillospiraceae bacterium]MBR0065976.1 CDP-diacylglycerol--glycerol-3-phosphate 3-phosphatidyltransferase [Kiritimatiellia bacterium]